MSVKQWKPAWVGMGSNLDRPIEHLNKAQHQLRNATYVKDFVVSSFYLSKPIGPQDQPDFVNAVCTFNTYLSPEALLTQLQNIEAMHGRVKKRHWGERTLDLDILLYADRVISIPGLTIPHPEMLNRSFVIYPALEIDPMLMMPDQRSLAKMPLPDNDLVLLRVET